MAELSIDARYLNLVDILLGEALTEFGNLKQRGAKPGTDMITVQLKLRMAIAALEGEPYAAPVDPIHLSDKTKI